VVSRRRRAAVATFTGSPLGRARNCSPVQQPGPVRRARCGRLSLQRFPVAHFRNGVRPSAGAIGRAIPGEKFHHPGTGRLKENADFPYCILRDGPAKTEDDSLDHVARTQGKIVSVDGEKIAAYRDARGKLTLLSPVCTQTRTRANRSEKKLGKGLTAGQIFLGCAQFNKTRW
jgi:hypothetical protein